MNKKYDSIIFDLDGTLWNSTPQISICWEEVLKGTKYKAPSLDALYKVMGLPDDELMQILFPGIDPKEGKRLFDLCCDLENVHLEKQGGTAYEGIEETLKELSKKYRLAIVSNCNDGYIEAYFASMGTKEYFEDYESFGRTGLSKKDNIIDVIKRNGYKNAVYVGDTIWDMQSAQGAGIDFIHANYGFGDFEACGEVINSPKELLDILG